MVFAEKFHLYRGNLRLTIEIYSPQRTNYMVKVNLHFLSGQKVNDYHFPESINICLKCFLKQKKK